MNKDILRNIRKTIIFAGNIIFYILFIYHFFFQESWFYGSLFLVLFFILLHYFFIEFKKISPIYYLSIFLVAALLIMFMLGFENIWKLVSLYVIHLGFFYIITCIDNEVNNRKNISSWAIFATGAWFFSWFIAVSYAMMFVGKYQEFNLTCEDINQSTEMALDYIAKPLELSVEETANLQNYVENTLDASLEDLGISQDKEKNFQKIESYTWDFFSYSEKFGKPEIEIQEKTQEEWSFPYQETIMPWIENTLAEKDEVDQQICEVFISNIEDIYQEPWFRFSVITLLVLLLWPSIRLILLILSFINIIFFKFLNLIKVYRFETEREEVDEIY